MLPLSKERKTFAGIFSAFSEYAENYVRFEKKDQLYSLNISELTDSERGGYLNAPKLVFQNTLRESTCSRVLNTAHTNLEALLLQPSIDPIQIELEKISLSEI